MLTSVPGTAAIVDLVRGLTLDGDAWRERVDARAFELAVAGAAAGSRVAVCHADATAMMLDLLAIWRLGATAVPLSTSLVAAERARMVERLRPAVWVGSLEAPSIPVLPPCSLAMPTGGTHGGSEPPDPEQTALILMTSGTTGEAKGVSLTHRALGARLALNIEHIGKEVLARTLVLLPLHFGHGLIGNALTPLAAGGTIFLGHPPGLDGLARLGAVIDAQAITFLTSVPSLWRVALRASPPPAAGSLRRINVGSERLPSDLWQAIEAWAGGVAVHNMYGMTETANWIAGISGADASYVDGTVGRAWGGDLRIDAGPSQPAQAARGEILVASPSMMSGYLDDAGATAEALRDGWLHTGDIGEIDEAGNLRIVGRAKHQINRGGTKVSAEEVDLLLESHAEVAEACAFARPDPVSGETVAAAIVPEPGRSVDPDAIRRWCEGRIRKEAVPQTIHVVDALPRTGRGKLDRAAVRARILGPAVDASAATPGRAT